LPSKQPSSKLALWLLAFEATFLEARTVARQAFLEARTVASSENKSKDEKKRVMTKNPKAQLIR
jgi:hypothetical protein